MNLRLFSALWGNEAIETFKSGPLKSLLWPQNKAALEGNTWSIWTLPEHAEELERLIYNSIDVKIEISTLPDIRDQSGRMAPPPYLLHQPILNEMVACLNNSMKLLMLPPDTIFGEGSISNILKLGAGPETCVAVPHVRVLPHIVHHVTDEPVSNASLCKSTFECLHKSWMDAEKGSPISNSFWSGVHWERLNDKLISVTHRIPTYYLCSFNGQDHATWQNYATFGAWDHLLPGEGMIRQERQRFAGSSDAVMICEITGPGDNIPPAAPPQAIQQHGEDGFWVNRLHTAHNRQTQFIMRMG